MSLEPWGNGKLLCEITRRDELKGHGNLANGKNRSRTFAFCASIVRKRWKYVLQVSRTESSVQGKGREGHEIYKLAIFRDTCPTDSCRSPSIIGERERWNSSLFTPPPCVCSLHHQLGTVKRNGTTLSWFLLWKRREEREESVVNHA